MASHHTWDKRCVFLKKNKSGHTDSFHDLQPIFATSFLFPTFVLSQLSSLITGMLKFIPALGPLHFLLSLECFFHGFTWLAPSYPPSFCLNITSFKKQFLIPSCVSPWFYPNVLNTDHSIPYLLNVSKSNYFLIYMILFAYFGLSIS